MTIHSTITLMLLTLLHQCNCAEIKNEDFQISQKEKAVAKLMFTAFSFSCGFCAGDLARLKVSVASGGTGLGPEVQVLSPELQICYDWASGMPRSIMVSAKKIQGDEIVTPDQQESFYPSVDQARSFLSQTRILQHLGFSDDVNYQVDMGSLNKMAGGFYVLSRCSQGYCYDDELIGVGIVRIKTGGFTIRSFRSSINYSMNPPVVKPDVLMNDDKIRPDAIIRDVGWVRERVKGKEGGILDGIKEDIGKRRLCFCHANDFFVPKGANSIGYDRTREVALCRRYSFSTVNESSEFEIVVYIDVASGLPHAGFLIETQANIKPNK